MQRLSKSIAWIGFIAFALPVTAQEQHAFSVQQAVDYAKQNNVQVKNALLGIQLQQEQNREITSAAYPHINGNFGTTYNPNVATQVIPNFISPATYQVLVNEGVKNGSGNPITMPNNFDFIAAQFGTKWSANAGLDLSQILFDGQVFVGLQARATSIEWVKKNAEVTEEAIKANIHKVYYQLVAGKTQIELIDANITRFEKLLSDTKEIFKNGFAEKLDISKLEVQLANLRTEKLKAQNSIRNGYEGLKILMGMPVRDSLALTDSLSYEKLVENMLDNPSYDYKDRKEFQYAELGKKLNEYNIKRYKLSQIPTVSLSGSYYKNAQRDKFNFFNKGEWFTISSVGLKVSVPIFNGFVTKAKIAQAQIQLKQTENQLEALKLNIDNEVVTARNNFTTAIATVDYQKKNMQLAEEVYNQTRKKFEVGTGSNTEITTAQTELRTAQLNYIGAIYDAIIARVDYMKAIGKL